MYQHHACLHVYKIKIRKYKNDTVGCGVFSCTSLPLTTTPYDPLLRKRSLVFDYRERKDERTEYHSPQQKNNTIELFEVSKISKHNSLLNLIMYSKYRTNLNSFVYRKEVKELLFRETPGTLTPECPFSYIRVNGGLNFTCLTEYLAFLVPIIILKHTSESRLEFRIFIEPGFVWPPR